MSETLPVKIRKNIEQIRLDNTSGSVELAKKSAELLIHLVDNNGSHAEIKNAASSLTKAQPTMASIFNLVNNVMIAIDKDKNQELKHVVQHYCKKFLQDLQTSDESIRNQVINHIKDKSTIITHSYSATVLSTLLFAKKAGKKFSVICTESRPKNEGILLAKQLGSNNINVKLIVDSTVFSLIADADMILVGGDAITTKGLINKIGTKGIAMVAHHYKIPMYALCSTIKFLPDDYPVALDLKKNPHEILSRKISNITPINYYFDCTPLNFLTGIITEQEILQPTKIKEYIKHQKIHNIFKK